VPGRAVASASWESCPRRADGGERVGAELLGLPERRNVVWWLWHAGEGQWRRSVTYAAFASM
jgi:hypothetical protein